MALQQLHGDKLFARVRACFIQMARLFWRTGRAALSSESRKGSCKQLRSGTFSTCTPSSSLNSIQGNVRNRLIIEQQSEGKITRIVSKQVNKWVDEPLVETRACTTEMEMETERRFVRPWKTLGEL